MRSSSSTIDAPVLTVMLDICLSKLVLDCISISYPRRVIDDGYVLELSEFSFDYDVAEPSLSIRFAHRIASCHSNGDAVRGSVALHLRDAHDSSPDRDGLYLFVLTIDGSLHRILFQDPRSVSFESVYSFDAPSSSLSLLQAHVRRTHACTHSWSLAT